MPITVFDPAQHAALLDELVAVHVACSEADARVVATWLPPFSDAKRAAMRSWYAAQGADPQRTVFMELSEGGRVAGFVVLDRAHGETSAAHATVRSFHVAPAARRRGVARRLLAALEARAAADARTFLLLSTARASDAYKMYPRLGYTEYGVLPDFVVNPADGTLLAEACFYKDLTKSPVLEAS